jgi:hypothetical protein
LCGIRTHDPGFRAKEDNTCLRPLGYRDRQAYICYGSIFVEFEIGAWQKREISIYLSVLYQVTDQIFETSDRRLSAKLVPTLVDRGCRVVSAENLHGRHSLEIAPQLSSRG